ncbi:hypothetical protein F444_14847, partial [Phytophthora nicotianae P1976]
VIVVAQSIIGGITCQVHFRVHYFVNIIFRINIIRLVALRVRVTEIGIVCIRILRPFTLGQSGNESIRIVHVELCNVIKFGLLTFSLFLYCSVTFCCIKMQRQRHGVFFCCIRQDNA